MVRFWPTLGIACLLALVAVGLFSAIKGRPASLEGTWLGNLPLDGGEDCRIKIYPTGSFDLECRGTPTYAARGTWRRSGDDLRLDFTFFAREGQFPRRTPEPWTFRVKAQGNQMELGQAFESGLPYKWKRAPL